MDGAAVGAVETESPDTSAIPDAVVAGAVVKMNTN